MADSRTPRCAPSPISSAYGTNSEMLVRSGGADFDAAEFREHVAELEAVGVTHLAVNGVGTSVDEGRQFVESFAAAIMG